MKSTLLFQVAFTEAIELVGIKLKPNPDIVKETQVIGWLPLGKGKIKAQL